MPWLTHFRPDGCTDQLQYDPGRFLSGQQHGYNYLPFGGGSNHCIGSGWSIELAARFIRRLTSEYHVHGASAGDDPLK